MKKLILLSIPFCLSSIPNRAFANNDLEKIWHGYLRAIFWSTCSYYKQGFLPEELAKRDFKFWFPKIDEKIKNKIGKDRLISEIYKDPKCRNLMP